MSIEIKTKKNNEEKVDVRILKNPLFGKRDLRKEIFKRAGALKLA